MLQRATLEFAYVFEDALGWWASLSGKLLGPYKTRAEAMTKKVAYE